MTGAIFISDDLVFQYPTQTEPLFKQPYPLECTSFGRKKKGTVGDGDNMYGHSFLLHCIEQPIKETTFSTGRALLRRWS